VGRKSLVGRISLSIIARIASRFAALRTSVAKLLAGSWTYYATGLCNSETRISEPFATASKQGNLLDSTPHQPLGAILWSPRNQIVIAL
jgi:hypothetical protein